MKKNLIFTLSLLVFSFSIVAQEAGTTPSIEQQFSDVINKSNSYQDFKVIKKFKINQLQVNVLDTINSLRTEIDTLKNELGIRMERISNLESSVSSINSELESTKKKENSMSLFGITMQKGAYNTLMWTIIGGLFILLLALIVKFRRTHASIRAARVKLVETEDEFEAHRRKTLENEQVLRRKLQDEINKNRNLQ